MNPISITNPWVLLTAGVVAVGLASGGYVTGRIHGADKCAADKLASFQGELNNFQSVINAAASDAFSVRDGVVKKSEAVSARATKGVSDARDLARAGDKSSVSPILACVLIRQRGLEDPRCSLPASISGDSE